MYNSDKPTRAELPTTGQLLRSTLLAAVAAAVLLITVVLPAEYGIDPTGAGQMLGLKEMGDIKVQLQNEAEEDGAADAKKASAQRGSSLWNHLGSWVIGSAHAQTAPAIRTDETSVILQPGESVELKASLTKGQKIAYSWKTDGGKVNHDTHGEPHNNPNATTSYSKGRGVEKDEGTLEAAFDGSHGWFWRNRTQKPVTVTLKTSGDYTEIKRMK
jgi:hypothetical protein